MNFQHLLQDLRGLKHVVYKQGLIPFNEFLIVVNAQLVHLILDLIDPYIGRPDLGNMKRLNMSIRKVYIGERPTSL